MDASMNFIITISSMQFKSSCSVNLRVIFTFEIDDWGRDRKAPYGCLTFIIKNIFHYKMN